MGYDAYFETGFYSDPYNLVAFSQHIEIFVPPTQWA